MAVPDLALICEIMLMAEGFQQSKVLSRKFIILYKLCEGLLSKVSVVQQLLWRRQVPVDDDSIFLTFTTIGDQLASLQSRHYDWKLRAIKTTLYVAGSMKRAAPELSGRRGANHRRGLPVANLKLVPTVCSFGLPVPTRLQLQTRFNGSAAEDKVLLRALRDFNLGAPWTAHRSLRYLAGGLQQILLQSRHTTIDQAT